ncbi:MAG TPA: cyclase family protein [Acidobacteriaceae bacterium]|nr:cyclase family protein [Acidobacteriaceae bacterium]
MRIQTFVIGYVLALALLVFAKHRTEAAPAASFRGVVDLTNSSTPLTQHKFVKQASGTHIDAPAQFARGMWTVDQIPPERLIAPLVVLDVRANVQKDPDYRVSVEDIASWEQAHGDIPLGSVVMVRTGATSGSHLPAYSEDAAKFLVDGRNVLGLGIDTTSVDGRSSTKSPVHAYALAHSVYPLENVANLERLPPTGAVIVVAPQKVKDGTSGPARLFALLH